MTAATWEQLVNSADPPDDVWSTHYFPESTASRQAVYTVMVDEDYAYGPDDGNRPDGYATRCCAK